MSVSIVTLAMCQSLRPALTSSYEGSYIFGYTIQPINPLNNDQTPKHSATRQK